MLPSPALHTRWIDWAEDENSLSEVMGRRGLPGWPPLHWTKQTDAAGIANEQVTPVNKIDALTEQKLARLKLLEAGKMVSPIASLTNELFNAYDKDGDGRLSVGELGSFLRDHGVHLDYTSAHMALEWAAGEEGANSIGRDEFAKLVVKGTLEGKGYPEESKQTLRLIFDRFADCTGLLKPARCWDLLAQAGHVPRTHKESQELGQVIAHCRVEQVPGPLSFDEFLTLAMRLQLEDHAEDVFKGFVVCPKK